MSSSLSLSSSAAGPSASGGPLPSSSANNGTGRGSCWFDSSIDNCFAHDSPDTREPTSNSCCVKVGGSWNGTCEVCMFPHHDSAEEQINAWKECYGNDYWCSWSDHKANEEQRRKDNAAIAVGPKIQVLAVVFAAALAALS